jgi:hypothetical protein
MSILDNFIKNYGRDDYKHYLKTKITVRIVCVVLQVVLILGLDKGP